MRSDCRGCKQKAPKAPGKVLILSTRTLLDCIENRPRLSSAVRSKFTATRFSFQANTAFVPRDWCHRQHRKIDIASDCHGRSPGGDGHEYWLERRGMARYTLASAGGLSLAGVAGGIVGGAFWPGSSWTRMIDSQISHFPQGSLHCSRRCLPIYRAIGFQANRIRMTKLVRLHSLAGT